MQDVVNSLIIEIFKKNPLFWILIIAGILCCLFYKEIVGKAGEYWTKKELKKLGKEYLIINDLMIRTEDKKTHQIDHVVISKYGIFVIETKQYDGYITGNDYDKKWCMKAGKNKLYINNPVHQNYGHIKALQEVLKLNEKNFISIVCMSGNAKLKIKSNKVVKVNDIIDKIKSYQNILIDNCEEIYNELRNINITDRKQRNKHNREIKNTKRN